MNLKQDLKIILQNRYIRRLIIQITRNKSFILLSILILAAIVAIVASFPDKDTKSETEQTKDQTETTEIISSLVGDYSVGYLAGEVQPNQGLFQAVLEMGVGTADALKVINVLRFNVELITIRAGEKIWIKPAEDNAGIKEFIYQPDSVTYHKILWDPEKSEYAYSMMEKPTEYRYRVIDGSLAQGSSLNDMLLNSNVPSNLTGTINEVLQCKISFRTDAREGDRFKILLQERYYGEEWISGTVMYAAYEGKRTGFHEAFRYSEDDPKSSYNAYYTLNGEALINSGLRYPLDRLHIVSSYGMREHPVTGQRQMHNGVDYRARQGTNVHAVAKGQVIVSSYDSLSGNKIAIRHSDGSSSWYLHLSKRSVKKGQTVNARQVIGTSGATGRVNGPHLHFGFKNAKNQWINPLGKRMIATTKLEGSKLARLKAQVENIRRKLDELERDSVYPLETMVLSQ